MVSKTRTVPYRRRRENKTDYKSRMGLLKSKEIRFVVRKSLKNLIVQAVQYKSDGDKILFTVSSKELEKMGWKNSRSNVPSAYLVGLLAGKKSQSLKINKGILDLGVNASIKGSRIYAALKGLLDSGLNIPCSDKNFPTEDRILGKHIQEYKKIDIEKDFIDFKNKIMA
jgi:large subunit ribosomal protein L18